MNRMEDRFATWVAVAKENASSCAAQYNRIADPRKYIYVDPLSVRHHSLYSMRTRREQGSKLHDWGKILDGDWDLELSKRSSTGPLAEALASHFLHGVPWEKVLVGGKSLFERKLKQIDAKGSVDGCRNRAELILRYERLDRLFESIRKDGCLQTSEERGAPLTDDLFVAIGRGGEFLFTHGGSHRLAIAQVLKLTAIPVRVLMRHRLWQERREAVPKDEKHAAEHPDFSDLVGSQVSHPAEKTKITPRHSEKDIQDRVRQFAQRQNWMHNIALTPSVYTIRRTGHAAGLWETAYAYDAKMARLQTRGAKEGLIHSLDLRNKTVLDVACGEGKYSFYCSRQSRSVLGIDIDEERIEKALFVKDVLGVKNVEFKVMNLYSKEFASLDSYDFALCLGLLHRLPDPFSFVNAIALKVKSALFEWKTTPNYLSQDLSWGYHAPGGLYEWQNAASNFESKEIAAKGRAGGGVNRASYWYLSFGALEAMCARAGFRYFLRFSRAPMYGDFSREPAKLTPRVMLLASIEPLTVLGRTSSEGSRRLRRREKQE